jgi:hypothetical protein
MRSLVRRTVLCVVYNPARSPSHGINLPDFQGQYTSMPCDGPSGWEGFCCLFFWNDLNGASFRIPPAVCAPSGSFISIIMQHESLTPNTDSENQIARGLKKGIRKILTGTSVPLDTCLLMGDPLGAYSYLARQSRNQSDRLVSLV